MTNSTSRRTRLAVQTLEDRTVPAFNLMIDGDVAGSVNIAVDEVSQPGTTIFSANASGAVLDVDAVEAALAIGDVLITSGNGGGEAGNISYSFTNPPDNFDYLGATTRTVTI